VASAWAPNGPELARAGFASPRSGGGVGDIGEGAKGKGWSKKTTLKTRWSDEGLFNSSLFRKSIVQFEIKLPVPSMTLLCFSGGKVREAAETSHRVTENLFGVLPIRRCCHHVQRG